MPRLLRVTVDPLPNSVSDEVQLPDDWDDMTERARQDFRLDMVSLLVWENIRYTTVEVNESGNDRGNG